MEGCEAAAKPPPHTPYHQWHGVISTAGRNLVIYLLFDFFDGGLAMTEGNPAFDGRNAFCLPEISGK